MQQILTIPQTNWLSHQPTHTISKRIYLSTPHRGHPSTNKFTISFTNFYRFISKCLWIWSRLQLASLAWLLKRTNSIIADLPDRSASKCVIDDSSHFFFSITKVTTWIVSAIRIHYPWFHINCKISNLFKVVNYALCKFTQRNQKYRREIDRMEPITSIKLIIDAPRINHDAISPSSFLC